MPQSLRSRYRPLREYASPPPSPRAAVATPRAAAAAQPTRPAPRRTTHGAPAQPSAPGHLAAALAAPSTALQPPAPGPRPTAGAAHASPPPPATQVTCRAKGPGRGPGTFDFCGSGELTPVPGDNPHVFTLAFRPNRVGAPDVVNYTLYIKPAPSNPQSVAATMCNIVEVLRAAQPGFVSASFSGSSIHRPGTGADAKPSVLLQHGGSAAAAEVTLSGTLPESNARIEDEMRRLLRALENLLHGLHEVTVTVPPPAAA